VSHGPVTRSHATKLPKKVRKLGVKHALSAKFSEGKLLIIDSFKLEQSKTSILDDMLKNFPGNSFFIIDNNKVEDNLLMAVRNIKNATAVPQIGVNVYDIIKHDCILLSKDAVSALEERLR
jgi:large subunit ribosomal protein L4